jgi:hypothetical protein
LVEEERRVIEQSASHRAAPVLPQPVGGALRARGVIESRMDCGEKPSSLTHPAVSSRSAHVSITVFWTQNTGGE